MIDSNQELILQKIGGLHSGQQCGLKEMFGDDWEKIGTSGERKTFGSKFKKAVENGEIQGIRWVRIENSGRFDVYEKS